MRARDASGRTVLFGEVIERALDKHFDSHARQLPREVVVPLAVGPLAGGEHDARDGARGFAHQVRRGQFDDAPDAAGAKVIMDDDQLHRCSSVANGARWSIVCVRKGVTTTSGHTRSTEPTGG